MKYLNFPMFFFFMSSGVMITLNSSSWFSAWLGMELNILGFLPMMMNYKNILSYEMIMKYFLISSVTSMVILFFSFSNLNFWMFGKSNLNNILILVSLMMKLGSAPFHYWFISLGGNLEPFSSFFLFTFQKLPPLFLLNMNIMNYLMISFLVLSSLFGSLGGIYQFSTMKLLAFSSISHLAWMFTCIIYFNNIWMLYFFTYTLMLYPIILLINKNKIFHLNKIMDIGFNNKIWFCLSILSLGGFPPLLGFFPKMLIIMLMIKMKLYFLSIFLIFMSMVNLYFYMRMMYNFIFTFYMSYPLQNMFSMNYMSFMIPMLFPFFFIIF